MEVPHWSAKQSLEDGMLWDWFPGESVVGAKADPQFTLMFSTTKHIKISLGEPGKDTCSGDGGSPLVCQAVSGRWHVM